MKYPKSEYYIGLVYRPSQKNVTDFLNTLQEAIFTFISLNTKLICGGDVDIDQQISESKC